MTTDTDAILWPVSATGRFSIQGTPERVNQLDSLRGIAAVIVMLTHFVYVFPCFEKSMGLRPNGEGFSVEWFCFALRLPPLSWLFSGSAMVILFFVLSGFSLHRMLRSSPDSPIFIPYLKRRTVRIYFPYIAALLLSIALNALCSRGPISGVSRWFNETWQWPISGREVLAHLLFIGKYDYTAFNTAFWSLAQEMRISLVFPFLYVLTEVRSKWIGVIVTLTLLAVGTVLAETNAPRAGDPLVSVLYAGVFMIGMLISQNAASLTSSYRRLTKLGRMAFTLAACLLLFQSPSILNRVFHVNRVYLGDVFLSIGAGGILILALSSTRASRSLQHPMPVWLGKISYSIYLLHGSVLFALVRMVSPRFGPMVILVPYLALTLLTAHLFYVCIERRAIQYSRSFSVRERSILA